MSDNGPTKAQISRLTKENEFDRSQSLTVLFNPKDLTFSKQNNWKENNSPKEVVPFGEFTGGGAEVLKVQLHFDTYGAGEKDVRSEYTEKLRKFMEIDPETIHGESKKGRPPLVRFLWNALQFDGVVASVNERLTLFLPNGIPVRAVVDLTLKQIRDEKTYKKQNPTSGGVGGERVWTVREGDTLSWIAYVEYDNASQWRRIADANRLSALRDLRPGTTLVIPNV